ncbi:SAF domain-containing protein [Mariniblastus fucicola]|uniref:SAF domain-containing protein n=1 Tax=Mariniblastus fucicola TaxID=980251 RepID=UPI0012FCCBB2|nr:SAF domain-containing protein [Mariniblastus fucicola]
MRFSLRTILLAALLLPAACAWSYLYLFPQPIPVVVATGDLDRWTLVTSDDLELENWPASLAPTELPSEKNEVTGKYLRHRARRGMAISNSDFASLEEIIDFLTTRPKHGSNIITVDCGSDGDVFGMGPIAGDRVQVFHVKDGVKRIIAGNALVVRDYRRSADTPNNVYWSMGIELTDSESIDYIESKQDGKVDVQFVEEGG